MAKQNDQRHKNKGMTKIATSNIHKKRKMELIENYCIFLWFIINDVIIKINGKNSILFLENNSKTISTLTSNIFLFEDDLGKEWDNAFRI